MQLYGTEPAVGNVCANACPGGKLDVKPDGTLANERGAAETLGDA